MARDRHKGGRDRTVGTLEGRPKALRRELSDLESELERARRRRDRAQARVEALEAIAEQLAVALAVAEAARERRRTRRDQTVEAPLGADVGAEAPTTNDVPDRPGDGGTTTEPPRSTSDDEFVPDPGGAVATATVRGTRRAKSARKVRPGS